MHEQWKKVAAVSFLTFLVLWIVGFLRILAQPYPQAPVWPVLGSEEVSLQRTQNANNLKQLGLARTPLPNLLDQGDLDRIHVFEKNAQLAMGTTEFADDVAHVRSALAEHQATVFHEKSSGLAPERRLTLQVGVHPDRFDALVDQLREIGHLDSISVTQRDRTAELRRLHAQRQSLKKHLEAVRKLRGGKNPSVEDELKVEQKIQDIEKELQTLSVQFGELLGEESFYNVYFTLFEYQPGGKLDRTSTLPRRLLHAFLWALQWWCAGVAGVVVLAGTWVSLRVLWPGRSGSRG
jgi:hypothetical protein